jgi:hypothetical protein
MAIIRAAMRRLWRARLPEGFRFALIDLASPYERSETIPRRDRPM